MHGAYGADPANELFNPEGGGAAFPTPPAAAYVGNSIGWVFVDLALANVGSATAELVAATGPLTLSVCEALNDGLGLANPPQADDDDLSPLITYPGSPSACIGSMTIPGTHTYYHALEVR